MKQVLGLFPGQGSQKVGMGKDLYEKLPKAQELFECADKALGFSLRSLCFEGPEESLTLTAHSQPAILTVSCICYEMAKDHFGDTLEIVAAAGHSLGEYSALVAAGSISFEDAVLLVHKRGSYMQEATPEGSGAMLAVLGKETQDIQAIIDTIDDVVEIANVNAPGQIVISGSKEGIDSFQQKAEGFKTVPLSVSAPFHCSLMKPAAERLAADLDAITIQDASFPIYANVLAAPIQKAADIRQALKDQVCGQVRWVESMQAAIKDCQPALAVEFGQGNVLSNLLKRIDKQLPRKTMAAIEDLA